jgi:hypothetical protein
MLVAMNYFMKWTEVVPLKNMTHKEVIEFIMDHIIHRFGIPQTFTMDQGTSFTSSQVREFTDHIRSSCSIHLLIMLRPMVRPSLAIKP